MTQSNKYKVIFLHYLEQAMQLLNDYGHITHYMDLPNDINNQSIELAFKMDEIENQVEDLSITDSEKYLYFQRWYIRLDLAGIKAAGRTICAACIPEKVWGQIEVFDYEDIINRSENFEEFFCSKCEENRGGQYDPKFNWD